MACAFYLRSTRGVSQKLKQSNFSYMYLYYADLESDEKVALTLLAKFILPKEKKKNVKETDMKVLQESLSPLYSEHNVRFK